MVNGRGLTGTSKQSMRYWRSESGTDSDGHRMEKVETVRAPESKR